MYLRKDRALSCPIHRAIKDEAAKRLAHSGVFSKEEVLDALNFRAVEDAIRWDYVREFLQEDEGCELVPLALSFFEKSRTEKRRMEEKVNPTKFLAQGHGKKTIGYAAVTSDNDALVVARIQYREKVRNGVDEKFRAYVKAVQDRRGTYLPDAEVPVLQEVQKLTG